MMKRSDSAKLEKSGSDTTDDEDRLKNAEGAMPDGEARYLAIIEDQTELICRYLPDGRLSFVNEAYTHTFGKKRQDLLYRNFIPHIPEPDLIMIQEHLGKLSPDTPVARFDHRVIMPDGTIRWQQWTHRGIYSQEARLIETQAVGRDITDLKLSELERERYFNFFRDSRDLMVIADPNGAFIKTNPACTRTLGYSEAELTAKPFIDFVHPDDKQATLDEMARQLQRGFSLDVENRYVCKDSSVRWLSWRATYNKDEGLTYATARDITERKQMEETLRKSEEKFRALFESAKDGVILISSHGDIVSANAAFARRHGYTVGELRRMNLKDIDTPESAKLAPARLQRLFGGEPMSFEVEHRCKNGQTFPIEVSANLVVIGGEKYILAFERDITDRKKAEEQIRRSLKEKEVMLKEIHHRVKNNMQVVCSLLNLQAKAAAEGPVRTILEESRDRVKSMALIHENLYQSADLAHVDFKAYLQSLIVGVADTHNRPDVGILVVMPDIALDVNVSIPCGLIINELISNSLKHAFPEGKTGAPKPGNTIRVGFVQNNEHCILTVADNGIGFPAKVDFRNTPSLGLQLVNLLAGQIDGTVNMGTVGGTTFTITFPGTSQGLQK